ncbi:MAG: hypothetical protein CSA60_04315 [Neptuniibacter caesariensis]|uniref:Zinc finger/thioredoxin putative domain-containing protein n=1 Tax=Neptuniibacter caesariensis TaxID=207954 RepID=A0A2G6JJR0_NEPCE|nr:MAG: hypothetical protein CSA60_04315 [Neptuniibacter caesariensis]
MYIASIVTECPACSTRFKVTPGQLKIAHGQVRCGHCLQVFSAVEHKETRKPTKQRSAIRKQPPGTTNKTATPTHAAPKSDSRQTRTTAELAQNTKKPYTPQPSGEEGTAIENQPSPEQAPLSIQAEPVTLTQPIQSQSSSFGWLISLFIALSLLAGQLFWFNRAELSQKPTLAPVYAMICGHFQCNLPTKIDLEKVSNQQISIKPHPEIENAILLDLSLINTADFQQPYPLLKLNFSDLKGRPVAGRIFHPADYLSTELARANRMPINQPVQITLELMSPGPRGISYSLELLASQP